MKRTAVVNRKTSETDISLSLDIDGSGKYEIKSPVAFLNHMLELFAKHGFFNLTVKAEGDVEIDFHHTVEDLGICLGQAFKDALGDKKDIRRYGNVTIPMDEALSMVSLDISARPCLVFNVSPLQGKVGDFDIELVEEFFQGFVNNSGTTLHITVSSGKNHHHIIEAIFKAFARAMDMATQTDARAAGIPSTKGIL